MKRALAAAELIFIAPASLFFIALFLRNFLPLDDSGNGPQQIVQWYAGRRWSLWILLLALPFSALVLGATALRRSWSEDPALRRDTRQVIGALRTHLPIVICGVATVSATLVLFFVALHMAAD